MRTWSASSCAPITALACFPLLWTPWRASALLPGGSRWWSSTTTRLTARPSLLPPPGRRWCDSRRDEDGGLNAARNAGIRAASGDLVAFTDDDCEPAPTWLRELIEPMRDPTVDGVAGPYGARLRL